MAKQINTRIQLKYDTYANWTDESKGANLVLKQGEIGICAIDSANLQTVNPNDLVATQVMFKVGDGTTAFKNLQWASALAADVYSWAKQANLPIERSTTETGTAGNVISTIKFENGKIIYTTATVATSEGLAQLTNRVSDIETNMATDSELEAAVNVINQTIATLATKEDLTTTLQGYVLKSTFDSADLGDFSNEAGYAKSTEVEAALADAKKYADDNDTNTAHTHTSGRGTSVSAAGGISGEVEVNLNIGIKLENEQIVIYDDTTGDSIASMSAAELVEDSYLDDVTVDDSTSKLKFTFILNNGATKEVEVDLTDLVDIYTGSNGDTVAVTVDGYTINADVKEGSLTSAHLAAGAAILKSQLATAVQSSLTKADNAVPNTTTINGKALNGNITLTPTDIGAATEDDISAAIAELDSSVSAAAGKALTGIGIEDGIIVSHTEIDIAGTYATKAEVEALTTDDIDGGAEIWIFNCGTSTTVI